MNRFAICVVIFIVLFLGVYYAYINSYVKYTPITNYHYDFLEQSELNTDTHKKSLAKVLDDKNVEWKMEDGEIYIKRKWVLTKNAIVDLTNKANEAEYVKYIPAVLNNPNVGYEDAPELKVNMENLKLVLNSHEEKWKEENGQLFITKRLALDKEMVHNYTRMANEDKSP